MKRFLIAAVLAIAAIRVHALPFIDDDYTAALARAKTKKAPIFVEAWAPW